ncbi:MAG TPA: AAA family ATPase [Alphaproteobacteria bacterium]|nr:AAA family ATPase [Alphaproteobacteria bacterium]
MYLDFFGLAELPFRLTPDTRFFYESRGHAKALSYMQYGLHKGEGFVVVTGDIGAGKTLLADTIMAQLGPRSVSVLSMTQLDPPELIRMIGRGFGIAASGIERSDGLLRLAERTAELGRNGGPPLILIDEAQNLPLASLEELRMLSNLRNGPAALLQVLLVGQPSLRSLLARPELEQLMQRVVAMCHLQPLGAAETGDYIRHRLAAAGWHGDPLIDEEVFALIHREARGVPRRINTLMDRLLLLGYLERRHTIDRDMAEAMAAELREEGLGPPPPALREVDR